MKYVKSETPTMDEFMRPILEYANRCLGLFTFREITDMVTGHSSLSAEARDELAGGRNIDGVHGRASWSISHLKRAEFLRQTGRSRYETIDAGKKEISSSNEIGTSYLMQNVPAYRRWKQGKIKQEV